MQSLILITDSKGSVNYYKIILESCQLRLDCLGTCIVGDFLAAKAAYCYKQNKGFVTVRRFPKNTNVY